PGGRGRAAAGAPAALTLLGGRGAEAAAPRARPTATPADTNDLVAVVAEASPEQVDEACAAAARAFPAWAATPPPDRARVLFRFRELLERHFDELAGLIVRENGKLLRAARGSLRRG